jgi:hypothetical protein
VALYLVVAVIILAASFLFAMLGLGGGMGSCSRTSSPSIAGAASP